MVRHYTFCDCSIKVGQNAKENWEIFKEAENNDLWFHLDGESSASAILSGDINSKCIKYTIQLMKDLHPKKNGKVMYRKCKDVKIGEKTGEFILN